MAPPPPTAPSATPTWLAVQRGWHSARLVRLVDERLSHSPAAGSVDGPGWLAGMLVYAGTLGGVRRRRRQTSTISSTPFVAIMPGTNFNRF